jgi:F-type H+-transporting ATPase subunit a
VSQEFTIDRVQGLHLGLSAGAVAVAWVLLSPLFAASLAAGAALEVANFRSLRRSCQAIFQSGLSGGGAAVSAFGLRFALLAVAVGLALYLGAHPVGLVIGLSLIVPSVIVARPRAGCRGGSVNIFVTLEHATHVSWVIWSALFVGLLLVVTGLLVRSRLAAAGGGIIPDEGLSLRNLCELVVEFLSGLAEQTMGENWRKYFPLMGTIFLFILLSNLIGLLPGIGGATSNANTTWGWAVISFVAFQFVGIKEHGWSYINHYLGPSMFEMKIGGRTVHMRVLAPLYAPIELIGHLARIFTLAIRLLANMFADHTVVGVWLLLVPVGVPAIFMGLGVLVAVLQAYVFTLLSMIYIGLALEEAH